MALSSAIVWEVRTTGNDGNGGGFKSSATGTDRTLQNGPFASLTAASKVHTTTTQINVALTDFTVSAADVGNVLQITGGTATAGFYEITNYDLANNRWTVDKSAGTSGQTVVGSMGGALASPAKIGGTWVAGNIIYIKAGTYDMSVNTINVSGGKVSSSQAVLVIGYNTNRAWGNNDTKPIIRATVTISMMWSFTSGWAYNIDFNGNSQAATAIYQAGAYTRCIFRNSTGNSSASGLFTHCIATGNASASGAFVVGSGAAVNCESYANGGSGFVISNSTLINCISHDNTGASTDGFSVGTTSSGHFFNCVAYKNGRDGFRTSSTTVSRMILQNCIAEDNVAYGINSLNASYPSLAIKCSVYNNNSGGAQTNGTLTEVATISPVGSVFTAPASADFSLNNTANRGALLRGTGYINTDSNVFPAGTTTAYPDVGAAQHQDSAAPAASEFAAAYTG